MKSFFSIILYASLGILFILYNVASCHALEQSPTHTSPTTFRRTIERVASLDPIEASSVYASRAVALTYETLLEYDYSARPYKLIPSLARALPAVSDDGLYYTFQINTNIYFSTDPCFPQKTRHITADDFVYSLKRLADANTASTGYWLLKGRIQGIDDFHAYTVTNKTPDYATPITGLTAPTPDTLQLTLTAPCPILPYLLAMPYAACVPHEAVSYYGKEFRKHPVGTGPYILASWQRNYKMVYQHNPLSRFTPEFSQIVFPIIDDPSTQWLSFIAGELDLQGEIPRENYDEVVQNGTLSTNLANRNIELKMQPNLEVAYIGINMDDPILGTNKKLRQALNAAFDAAGWEKYYRGRAIPSNGPVPPQVSGAITAPLPFGRGIETAQKLLSEAGYPDGRDPATGKRLRLTIDLGKTSSDMRESTELIIAYFDRIGIELIPEYSTWPIFLQKISERRSQLFRIAWVGDYPDAENFLQLFYGPNQSPGPNRCNYHNPTFDAIYAQAIAEPNEQTRLKLYQKLQEIVRDDCPWIFVSFAVTASLNHPTISNYTPHDFPYGMEKCYKIKGK